MIVDSTEEVKALSEHFIRPRINAILTQAIKKPLTIVCAGMGCGKTRAVYDFTQDCGRPVVWVPFSKSENNDLHLWEIFLRSIGEINKPLATEWKNLGFPDTEDKINMYISARAKKQKGIPCIIVFDDFHHAKNAAILKFMERAINDLPENHSVILISRELPQINISSLMMRDNIFIINEPELNFTESELSQFLLEQGLSSEIRNLKQIYEDTRGWAFLINFVSRMLKKSPGYMGYASNAIKQDLLQLIEMEVWNVISCQLKTFMLKLSLINHFSTELVEILAGNDESLIAELKAQNAFIRFNRHIDSYQIHRFLIDFLSTKQSMLSEEEIAGVCQTAAAWCFKNNFIADALSFYEKTGDYETIVSIIITSSAQIFWDYPKQIADIFRRAPEEVFDTVDYSAAVYIDAIFSLGEWKETARLIKRYKAKYMRLPDDSAFKRNMLGYIYYNQALLRYYICTKSDRYDFDIYFEKQHEYHKGAPDTPGCWIHHPAGLWTSMVGTARAGAPLEYIDALSRSSRFLQDCTKGFTAGIDDLAHGELLFYQGNVYEAERYIVKAIETATSHRQFEIIHRALLYSMRIAVSQGDYKKIEHALKEIEALLDYDEYAVRAFTYDIAVGWYYYILSQPERIPEWLTEKFSYHVHTSTLESFGNQIKARYCYMTKKHQALLTYMEEQKQRESIMFGRVEMLAMEACVHHKTGDNAEAMNILYEAYETAAPNEIVMPFIELGKDMRSLVSAALNDSCRRIPEAWLKNIKQAAGAYSRHQDLVIFDYRKKNDLYDKIILSAREKEILRDLFEGLSNSEIAATRGLSINTVKMHISSIYDKLGARNKADIFRIAVENNLLSPSLQK